MARCCQRDSLYQSCCGRVGLRVKATTVGYLGWVLVAGFLSLTFAMPLAFLSVEIVGGQEELGGPRRESCCGTPSSFPPRVLPRLPRSAGVGDCSGNAP